MVKIRSLVFGFVFCLFTHASYANDFSTINAERFANLWSLILAVEDQCEEYFSYTDATNGNHLSSDEYQEAKKSIPSLRIEWKAYVDQKGCIDGSKKTLDYSDLSFDAIWE